MAAMTEMFNSKLNDFQQELQKAHPSTSTSSLAAEFTTFRQFILSALETVQKQVEFLARDIDRLEMQGRRKILLLHGVPEGKTENTASLITSVISDKLQISSFSSDLISRSHRLGRPSGKKPRPILVKFREAAIRNKVWFAKTKLKGSGTTLSEFLTKSRHHVFMEARARFGITNCWSRDGRIHILAPDGSHHNVECMVELDAVPTAPVRSSPALPTNKPTASDPKRRQRSRSKDVHPTRKNVKK